MKFRLEHLPIIIACITAFSFVSGYAYAFGFFHPIGMEYLDLMALSDYVAFALDGLIFSVVSSAIIISLGAVQFAITHGQRFRISFLQPLIEKWRWSLLVVAVLVELVAFGTFLWQYAFHVPSMGETLYDGNASSLTALAVLLFVPLLLSIYSYSHDFKNRNALVLVAVCVGLAYFVSLSALGAYRGANVMRTRSPNIFLVTSASPKVERKLVLVRYMGVGILCKQSTENRMELILWGNIQSLKALSHPYGEAS